MNSKTKIVVLHLKELIYTGIFAALGILFVILLIIMFLPKNKNGTGDKPVPPDVQYSKGLSSEQKRRTGKQPSDPRSPEPSWCQHR